jgi:3-oxoacyl-[acyl-carrier protein] reductase
MIQQKVALVTGAARGIGNAIAAKLAANGCAIAIMDVLDEKDVIDNLVKFKTSGTQVLYCKGDITSDQSRKQVLDTIMHEFGRIDILVNNAGVAPRVRMDILQTTEESMDFVLGVNLKGTFFLTQLIANQMIALRDSIKEFHPAIVNIASVSAYASSTARAEYCISKAGISMVTTLFADRLAEHGIVVHEVRPGIIMTDMTSGVKTKYDAMIENGLTPIRRWGFPEDIARAVSVLCSGEFSFSTGEIINVDGGFHIRRL